MKKLLCKAVFLSLILMYSSESHCFLYNRVTKVEAAEINNYIDEEKYLMVPLPEGSVLL
jgi:hypothetical protein